MPALPDHENGLAMEAALRVPARLPPLRPIRVTEGHRHSPAAITFAWTLYAAGTSLRSLDPACRRTSARTPPLCLALDGGGSGRTRPRVSGIGRDIDPPVPTLTLTLPEGEGVLGNPSPSGRGRGPARRAGRVRGRERPSCAA